MSKKERSKEEVRDADREKSMRQYCNPGLISCSETAGFKPCFTFSSGTCCDVGVGF